MREVYLTVYSIIDMEGNEDIYSLITYGELPELEGLIARLHPQGTLGVQNTEMLSEQTLQIIGSIALARGLL